MDNQKIIEQFESHRAKLLSIQTFSDFIVWTRALIDLTSRHAFHLRSTIKGLGDLLNTPRVSNSARPKTANNNHIVPARKDRADEYINHIIDHLKYNQVQYGENKKIELPVKKSFWGEHFTVNALGTLLLAACTGGFYYMHTLGEKAGKNEMRIEVNDLTLKSENLEKQIKASRDSVATLKTEFDKCKTISNGNAANQLKVKSAKPH